MKSQVLCKNSIKLKPNCKQLCRIKLESDVYMQNLSVCFTDSSPIRGALSMSVRLTLDEQGLIYREL